ncbi:unnamed protein product, partial [Rotaria sp. Silwood2]
LHSYTNSTEVVIASLCTNSSTDKIFDNDDKYDVQSYMRTINTTEIALLDNFKYATIIFLFIVNITIYLFSWLIFVPHVREIWY